MKKLILMACFFAGIQYGTFAQQAVLKGRVTDAMSNEPLPFVNVIVSGTNIGAATDDNGNFQIQGLAPGFVRIEATFVGYRNVLSSQIEVSNAKAAFLEIKMELFSR